MHWCIHSITNHCSTFLYTVRTMLYELHYRTLHCSQMPYLSPRYIEQHCTIIHYTTLSNMTEHYATPHHTTPHHTTLKWCCRFLIQVLEDNTSNEGVQMNGMKILAKLLVPGVCMHVFVYGFMCVYVCVWGRGGCMCVCVCVCVRERENSIWRSFPNEWSEECNLTANSSPVFFVQKDEYFLFFCLPEHLY